MADQDEFEEAVLLFNADGGGIDMEFTFAQFERVVAGQELLEGFAASQVKAAFVVVGIGLAVRAAVFFTFKVNEEGRLDPHFNLPLRYLADHAGAGPDLGSGAIRLACRGQCPVPWHAVNLWQPALDGDEGSIAQVQRAVWRNRLGLKPTGRALPAAEEDEPLQLIDTLECSRRDTEVLEQRLTDAFGEEGRVNLENLIRQHNVRLAEITAQYRNQLAEQQRGYLEQIKGCRDEIRQLRSALRSEQQRSRRLQALLRGDP